MTVMDEGHHKLLTPNKSQLAMQVIETLLQIQPVGQVQLLNQGDIEVDFRLVHREGKFAPRLPGHVWSTEAPRASHVSKVVSMINFSTLQVQVHPGSWHYCRTLAQEWSFPEFGPFFFHACQRLITIVDACMFIGQWANGSPKNLRWVVNARSLWISSQRSLDHFTRPLYKIKKTGLVWDPAVSITYWLEVLRSHTLAVGIYPVKFLVIQVIYIYRGLYE